MNYGRTSLRRRAKQLDARGTRIRHKIGVILGKLLLIGIIVGGCATVSFGVGALKGILASAPDISEVDVIPTGYSTKVLAADGSETAKLVAAGSNRQYVTIDQIPENLQHAVVAIEDERFYDHNGIDLKGIVRALVADVRTRDFSQGASTLTQQLIKNNVLSEQWANENDSNISKIEKMERQVQRKIQEQYLAIELEKKVNDKNWILENYLNSINLGSNTLGVQAAAQRYFGKDVSKLTLSECAVIAGITKNPAGYNPILHPKENAKRRKNVLDAMKKQGYISQKQYDKAMADDVYGRISEHNDVREETMNTYFVDAVIDDVFDDLVNIKGYSESEAYKAIYQGGLTIKSTQNLQVYPEAESEDYRYKRIPYLPSFSLLYFFRLLTCPSQLQISSRTLLSFSLPVQVSHQTVFSHVPVHLSSAAKSLLRWHFLCLSQIRSVFRKPGHPQRHSLSARHP